MLVGWSEGKGRTGGRLTGEDGEVDFDVGPDHCEGEVVGEFS